MNEKELEVSEEMNFEKALKEALQDKFANFSEEEDEVDDKYEEDRIKRELTPAEDFIKEENKTDLINKHIEAGYAIGAMFKVLIQSGIKYDDAVAITANYNQLVVGDNIVAKSSSI